MANESNLESAAAHSVSSKSVRITESYHEYTPPFEVEPIIQRMLDSVPDKYLAGLSEVVLTNTSGMARHRRRAVTKSRKRKVRMLDARGLYHPAWHNQPAWIEIFVDNTLKGWERTSLWLPFMRNGLLGDVLFHEIGHHIHFASRPEHKEREEVADTWKARLERNYNRGRRPWLRALTSPIRPLIRALMKPMHRRMLKNGMISRAEFEELTNPNQKPL